MASSTDKGQRIGGLMSGTTVISTRPPSNYRLEDIARINTSEGYEPTYPEAVNLKEEDVVIVKRILERCKREKGKASEEALQTGVHVLEERLSIKRGKLTPIGFLQTILKDFVVLSR
jgi:hypothetical protein